MLGFLLIAFWMSSGALGCTLLAAHKGHDETIWLGLGAALGPLGIVALYRMPYLDPVSYLVSDPRLPDLVECPACRHTVARRGECTICSEPLPGGSPRPGRLSRLAARYRGRR